MRLEGLKDTGAWILIAENLESRVDVTCFVRARAPVCRTAHERRLMGGTRRLLRHPSAGPQARATTGDATPQCGEFYVMQVNRLQYPRYRTTIRLVDQEACGSTCYSWMADVAVKVHGVACRAAGRRGR